MDKEERESIISQLALVEGVNKAVFEKYTDEQLLKKMDLLYGNSEDN